MLWKERQALALKPYPDAYHVVLSPYPWSKGHLDTISERIKDLQTKQIVKDVRASRTEEALTYHLRFAWSRSLQGDAAYRIEKEAMELSPGVITLNVDEIAKHCDEESFHTTISISGLIQTKWKVPSSWVSIPSRTQRIVGRFVAVAISRAFDITGKPKNDLLYCPYYFLEGFSYDGMARALVEGVKRTCKGYSRFVDILKPIGNWQGILLYRAQCVAIINQLKALDGLFGAQLSARNEALAEMYEAERKLTSGYIDCLVNNVILWELGDSL